MRIVFNGRIPQIRAKANPCVCVLLKKEPMDEIFCTCTT